MSGETLILLALAIPLFAALATRAVAAMPDVRDTLTVVAALGLATVCAAMLVRTGNGDPPALTVAQPLKGLSIAFRLEPLGALFAAMASGLWAVNSLFSIGYMRGKGEDNQTRFYMCFAIALFGAVGVAMAANLFTTFIFYEVLTLSTYPLVNHRNDEASRKAGRIYMLTLLGTSMALLLPAVILIQWAAGSTDFVAGGVLAGKADPWLASLILALVVFGAAKAAIVPVHGWLPAAMVAPTPVSALLHAVAVVKTGVFVILKTSAMTFGPEIMLNAPAAQWLLWLASATIVFASFMALTKDELKARLAWSTIAQLAYITAGALMAATGGLLGGGLHMLTHAFGKITLFMCAGAIYVTAGVTKVSEMRGLGRRMPIVFAAFLVGALSVIGLPPFGGFWSKFLLITAAFASNHAYVAWAMIISSLLSIGYLAPIAIRALLPPEGDTPPPPPKPRRGALAPASLMVAPLLVTAACCVTLFFLADRVVDFLTPITAPAAVHDAGGAQ